MKISCECGQKSDYADFIRPHLETGAHQCPSCGLVFGKKVVGTKVIQSDLNFPPMTVPDTAIFTRPQLELNLR